MYTFFVYDWDEANEEHVALHGLDPEEVEEAMEDPERISFAAYNTSTERRYSIVGATYGGRIIRVIYTSRNNRLRVVTARDAKGAERRQYRR